MSEHTPFTMEKAAYTRPLWNVYRRRIFLFHTQDKDLAEFIVTACNEHEQLKETAEKYKSAHEVLAGECSKLMEEVGAENRQLKKDRAELIEVAKETHQLLRLMTVDYPSMQTETEKIVKLLNKLGEL